MNSRTHECQHGKDRDINKKEKRNPVVCFYKSLSSTSHPNMLPSTGSLSAVRYLKRYLLNTLVLTGVK